MDFPPLFPEHFCCPTRRGGIRPALSVTIAVVLAVLGLAAVGYVFVAADRQKAAEKIAQDSAIQLQAKFDAAEKTVHDQESQRKRQEQESHSHPAPTKKK